MGFAQIPFYKGNYIKSSKAKADLNLIHRVLKKNHPSYDWYTPAYITDAAFKNAAENIKDSIAELDFILLAAKCINNIKCGHTSLYYNKKVIDSINKSYTIVFPFNFIPIKDTLVNINCFVGNNNAFMIGTKIVAINGLTSKQIIDSLKPYFSGDGNADIYRERKMGNNFPFIYRNIFGIPKTLNITYINGEKILDTATCYLTNNTYFLKQKAITKPKEIVSAQVLDTIKKIMQKRADSVLLANKNQAIDIKPNNAMVKNKPKANKLTKKMRKQLAIARNRNITYDTTNSIATIYLNGFKGIGFRKFIKHSFKTIKKDSIKNVVIDVRDNGGGLISKYIYLTKYLADKKFKVADTVSIPYKNIYKRKYMKLGFWNQAFIWLFARKGKDKRYHIRQYERKYYKPKSKLHFDGNIYVITGAYSFSATTLFANNLKGQKNVTLVGDETGGGHYGNSGVLLPDIKLPNTNLTLHIPLFRVVINKNVPLLSGGVKPDVIATPTSESLNRNLDIKKLTVLDLIKSRKLLVQNPQ